MGIQIPRAAPVRGGSAVSGHDPVSMVASAILQHYAPAPARPRRWATPGRLAVALDKTTVHTPALDLIDAELVALADDPDRDRLIIAMPPQEGKSERCSRRFPEWLLDQDHDLRIAVVSYADEMARRWGGAIKRDAEMHGPESIIDLEIRLREDSRAAGRWNVKDGRGGVYCVGIAGSLTGKPVDWLIIDDPFKNMEQAQSPIYQERFISFYQNVAIPRLAPGAKVLLVTTRWHESDAAGWLAKHEPGRWRTITIPAVAESENDVLGRRIGEPMISARGERNWSEIKASVGDYTWAALYQQRPAPAAGGLFKRGSLRYWRWLSLDRNRHDAMLGQRIAVGARDCYLADCWRFITMDLAASTKTSADYTVAAVWAITLEGDLVLLDGDSGRIEESGHWELVKPLRERWSADTVFVESRMFGTTFVIDATKAGVPVKELKAETDKITRALPASARADTGRLFLPALDSSTLDVRKIVNELVQFPNGAHDDWVDVISYAARVVIAHWTGGQQEQIPGRGSASRTDVDRAFRAQTGRDDLLLSAMELDF